MRNGDRNSIAHRKVLLSSREHLLGLGRRIAVIGRAPPWGWCASSWWAGLRGLRGGVEGLLGHLLRVLHGSRRILLPAEGRVHAVDPCLPEVLGGGRRRELERGVERLVVGVDRVLQVRVAAGVDDGPEDL